MRGWPFLIAAAAMLPAGAAPAAPSNERARWASEAARVSITRDDWGIAHVHGRSDADAVFGMVYVQAEDDFNRVEVNYLTALGRLAEAEGEGALPQDLRQRLFVDPVALRAAYAGSPAWLRVLMGAWADGLNFYLATHPATHPRVLTRFEPWMALAFSEGSIGGDIERAPLGGIEAFYFGKPQVLAASEPAAAAREPTGSNGIAIAPANTVAGRALLLINPHTSFFFRAELQVTSDAGLNAYGAATWGQFFIYQGFNAHAGWMHTSSGVDNVDEFAETIVRRDGKLFYRYGRALRPVATHRVTLSYRTPAGSQALRAFTTYATHHGPIVRAEGGRWIAMALMNTPVRALEQSFLRTKSQDFGSFLGVAARQANSSNNTIFADSRGEIAYLHAQFVPRRDDRFDYGGPVDGTDPATDWQGLHTLASLPQAVNPRIGWVMNTNDHPWSAAGPESPRAADFPRYMDSFGENPRGMHATMLLTGRRDWTPERLIAAAYDSYLPAFAVLVPRLVESYDALPAGDPQRAKLAEPIELLRRWDFRWSASSDATALAVFWGDALGRSAVNAEMEEVDLQRHVATRIGAGPRLAALSKAVDRLERDFGRWRVPWGEINRFQRLDDVITARFDDAKPSIPVPFTPAVWGSLASFGARSYPNTKRYYGTGGNSFVAVVEFGPRVRAWAITAGGESGDPASQHFNDQAARYAAGALRPVYFYPGDLEGHVERRYHPGDGARP